MAFEDLKHAQRERLVYLDQLFFWEGRANRSDLALRFGISEPQAALDFKAYLERHRQSTVTYDRAKKCYVAAPAFVLCTPPRALADWLQSKQGDALFYELPRLGRPHNLALAARLYRAMRDAQSVNVFYQSMGEHEAGYRWIAPKRFASDGVRLHVRAWCFERNEYRDFIPARIDECKSFTSVRAGDEIPEDIDWHTEARVVLKPHHRLTAAQADFVRKEYGFEGDVLVISTRKALLFYIGRRWGLDTEGARLKVAEITYHPMKEEEVS